MLLNLSTIAPQAREGYIRIGKRFGSSDTLAQAQQTLAALAKYAPELVQHGFGPADVQRFADARETLEAESAGRGEVKGTKLVTTSAYNTSLARGKLERDSVRSILGSTERDLREAGGSGADEAISKIQAVLHETRRSPGNDAPKLADQLIYLRATLSDATIAAAAAPRGGTAALTSLESAITALRESDQDHIAGPGTLAATERLDLLDGLVVTLARSARKAARAAAKRLASPALAAEFELTCLYGPRGTSAPAEAPAATPAQPS